jgi:serine/threonine protein kinase/Flp pilus assembly protein TadD
MEGDPTRTLRVKTSRIRAGQTLAGKYRIIRELGRGGMGVVYEAEDLRLKRTVALKFLPPGLTADPEARGRFIHEAQAASGLDHPNICTIHEIDESETGGMYIAMAYYKGESLKEKLKRGSSEPAESLEISRQIAEGLAEAHEQGIVHRDVKPGNVMIAADGAVKILDFGLAKLAGEARLTVPGTTLGTAAYMSPEQARGDDVDVRTDVWSLGVVLYEMVSGRLPFRGDNEQAILHAVLHDLPRPVEGLRPGYPAEMSEIIAKALAKDPAKRFASAREMADALSDLKARLNAPSFPAAKRLTFRRSRRRLLVAASAVFLAVLAVSIWLLNRPSLAFESRDKLMVADADNLTGDKVFDLALRTAIEASLQQSSYASVFDKAQIAETLRLMRVDPSARVDEALGYDICKFAGVRAFILPRIMAVGEAYELEAILIDPAKRRHVDRIRVTARGRETVLLTGIDDLTKRLRSRLGESLNSIEKTARPVAAVTTSSWEALDYFSLAQAKRTDGNFKEAVALYELALDKDPKFVAARSSLALVLIQFMGEAEKGKRMLRQALEDGISQKLPERDLLPVKALNRQFVDGDLPGALAEYRTIMELFPDLMAPYNNSGRILQALGRYDEAAGMFEEACRRAPTSAIPLQNAWFLNMNLRKNPRAAESVARRYVALAPRMGGTYSLLGYSLAVQEKFDEAAREFRKSLELEPDHPYALPNLGHVLYAAGRAEEAVPFYRRVYELAAQGKLSGTPEWDGLALAMALRDAGRTAEAQTVLAEIRTGFEKSREGAAPDPDRWIVLAALDAVAGDFGKAEAYLQKVRPADIEDPYTLMNLAELYALMGKTASAVEHLKKSLASGFSDPFFPVILPEFQSIRKAPEFQAVFRFDR